MAQLGRAWAAGGASLGADLGSCRSPGGLPKDSEGCHELCPGHQGWGCLSCWQTTECFSWWEWEDLFKCAARAKFNGNSHGWFKKREVANVGNASALAFTTNSMKLMCSEVYCKINYCWKLLENGDVAEGKLLA